MSENTENARPKVDGLSVNREGCNSTTSQSCSPRGTDHVANGLLISDLHEPMSMSMSGERRERKRVRVPPKVGGRSANRRDAPLQLRQACSPCGREHVWLWFVARATSRTGVRERGERQPRESGT